VWPRPWGWGASRGTGPLARPGYDGRHQPIEPTAVPNIPAFASCQGFRNSSGSLAIFAAIRRASSLVNSFTAERPLGQ